MQVNPRQDMAVVPVTKSRMYLARPHHRTAIAGQTDAKSSQNSSSDEPRGLRRVISFEKGHLVDVYV